ncbi:MBL fold metallo-hydrolase [Celerinatantimonas diazotrophica]|uniref:Ribonuclease BN (tRNA processing enzyme) n=1 Tax=Celerinatantimonas diazotrophica TaxID=412034 RepID=A0A4R1JLY5_9GAMM|nr:MBL fold metallo-hydrolase [Celerinatantimonas diazotrophica]TCK52056.1 ribonuclease BN (tRNA processing enzyme) [Celerinatantimonas diazotrophica]CAG9296241.1 Ribonuclease BN [Celerinatantimonas diazotrophica]
MKVEMLGIGSAYSRHWTTSALWIESSKYNWLIDCGPTVPRALWFKQIDLDQLDIIYFTHIHPDHCLGLATLVNYLHSHHRCQPLTIMAQHEQQPYLSSLLEMASIEEPLNFQIIWQDIHDQGIVGSQHYASALSHHPVANRSLLLKVDDLQLFYSGDGKPTAQTIKLIQQADLIVHECGNAALKAPIANGHSHLSELQAIALTTADTPWRLYHCPDEHQSELSDALRSMPHMALAQETLLATDGIIYG